MRQPTHQLNGNSQMARQSHRRPVKKRTKKPNRQAGRLPRNTAPIEVSINHVGGRGDGVGNVLYTHTYNEAVHDIFVPASLPGEQLWVQPKSLTTQGIKAQIIEIISPSPNRHTPRCDAFPACGGCRFQHWDETAIRNWKQNLVITCLERSNVPLASCGPLQFTAKSRRRATFHLKCFSSGAVVGFRIYGPTYCCALWLCCPAPGLAGFANKVAAICQLIFPPVLPLMCILIY